MASNIESTEIRMEPVQENAAPVKPGVKALISINLAQNKYFRTHLDAFIFILNFLPPQMIGIYQNDTKLLQGIFLHWYLFCPGQPGVKWLPKQVYLNLKATWVLRCAQQRPSAAQVVPIIKKQ